MPFVEVNIQNEIEKQRQNNPEFRKAWDEHLVICLMHWGMS